MILECDAGNTRIKWRLLKETQQGLIKEAEGVVMAQRKMPSVFIELGIQLSRLPLEKINKMRVSNVRGEGFKDIFSSLMTEKWHLQPEFAQVVGSCAGVTNSYVEAGSLGVDRWLSMLAAYKEAQGACCIIDCGSAITLDVVNGSGQHQGGYIVPGFSLMQKALSRKSRSLEIGASQENWHSKQLGRNTEDAMCNGVIAMVYGLVKQIYKQYSGSGECLSWYVTGGDAGIISSFMSWEHKVVKDLVMDGLVISMSDDS